MPAKKENKDCFIIMPIADADGYPKGHFGHVYENIIKPSCEKSGYKAVRADEVKETNLIHLEKANRSSASNMRLIKQKSKRSF